ncbi:MAG: efflux RND transporter periplasmic adaptor subunit [Candidatus Cyclonatronum sp.]|uniref:efflux RND transporter periplasmic adaptor subunit n=1 Tax=Cyclonatronum sp. TaxID=3024185 RepID=UPI0025BA93BB|nr:efflux RND transporter periplasmic adaptor subunit [Cyclonatronum sp.]MCC5933600.1 efflux RND transporter periplasmic adaptor subunit [Balneolales bacterium]MCH8485956.1 efflux RND transporter periplasmic adaptor subunit [Cyclonatronum sp.]
MNRNSTAIIISILLGLTFLLQACSDTGEGEMQRRGGHIPTVEVIQTVMGSLPLEERLTGVVRARNQAEVFPEITAPVVEILVNSGDQVRKGQPLVRLRDSEARERVRQAEAGLQIAEAQVRQAQANVQRLESRLTRVQTLSVRNLESELELEQLEAEVEASRAALQLAQAQKTQAGSVLEERRNDLSNTVVKAPTDGFVGTRHIEVGQIAGPSTRLFEIGDTRVMTIRVSLTERMLGYIETGQTVNITSPAFGGEVIQTPLSRISPFINPVTNSAEAEIELQNPDGLLRAGMFVTVDILYGESEQAVLVPNNALFTNPNDGRRGVYVADRGALTELGQIEAGEANSPIIGPTGMVFMPVTVVAQGRQVSGVSGIQPGDLVVTIGQNLLASGREEARVRVTSWDRILELQQLQNRDLLDLIRQKLANTNGNPNDA